MVGNVPRGEIRAYGDSTAVLKLLSMVNSRKKLHRLKPRIRKRAAPGSKPGTVVIASDALPTTIRVMAYDKDHIVEEDIDDPAKLQAYLNDWPVVWIDVAGLGNEEKLRKIAEVFHIHPLALEDVAHVYQRAKVEAYDENLYIVLRIPDTSNKQLTEQFSMFLGKNYVVTFQERPGDNFDLVRAGLRHEKSLTRSGVRPDYLAYRLIDAAVDAYFPELERIGDLLDGLDEKATTAAIDRSFAELHAVRRELLMLRRAIWPLRDAMSELRSEVTPFISDPTRLYLRDCYDHAVQLIDLLESYRDIGGDVRDFYLSTISNRMNQVMKTLTVISTIFLPLSFIASIYGMNFNTDVSKWNMPELNWRYGYPFALALMAAVAIGMLINFKLRGWLSGDPSEEDERARQGDKETRRGASEN
jgi:magnesium transporter